PNIATAPAIPTAGTEAAADPPIPTAVHEAAAAPTIPAAGPEAAAAPAISAAGPEAAAAPAIPAPRAEATAAPPITPPRPPAPPRPGFGPTATAQDARRPASPPTMASRLSEEEMAALLARGDSLLSVGDVASARLVYERLADAGGGLAAIRLGETFDQLFL